MASTGASARRKGNVAERAVARWLRGHGWPDARTTRDARGGSQGGADITGVPGWSIEVKDQAVPRLAAWWSQAEDQALPDAWPLLVWHQPGVADPGMWLAMWPDLQILPTSNADGLEHPTSPARDWPSIALTGHVYIGEIGNGTHVEFSTLGRWAEAMDFGGLIR